MAIIAMVGAMVGGVYGLIQLVESHFFKTEPIGVNTEIVLDRSAGMGEKFDGTTKWEAALTAVEQSLELQVGKKDNLAFRQFGGPCFGENTQLLVKFDQNNKNQVRKALGNIVLNGETTLASAIIEASADFNDPVRFGGVKKTIIVITGGGDSCHRDAVQFIRDRLQERIATKDIIKVYFRFIGIGVSPDEKAQIMEIANNTGGRACFPESQEELDHEVARTFEEASYFLQRPLEVFGTDANVLAKFKFNGSVMDNSGNGRDAILLGGRFVQTAWGQGLHVFGSGQIGIDWSKYANFLIPPYTIEMILTTSSTNPWGKLFSFDDTNDNGWYYKDEGIQSYPHPVLARGKVRAGERHYFAFVSTQPSTMNVYYQGRHIGSTSTGFKAPPAQAIFFRDDTRTNRREQIDAVVEALRISKVARTPQEMQAVQQLLK